MMKNFVILILSLSSVSCEQMSWGDNPDLVDETNPSEGRDHIKLMVAMVGDTIDLNCRVLFTSKPVSKIKWTVNGNVNINPENATVTEDTNGVFIEEHFKITITEDMDGNEVSCEYGKDGYFGTREAILHVFTKKEYCDNCTTVFYETKTNSPGELLVEKRIKEKIVQITSSTTVERVDNIYIVRSCNCGSSSVPIWPFILAAVVVVLIVVGVLAVILYKKKKKEEGVIGSLKTKADSLL